MNQNQLKILSSMPITANLVEYLAIGSNSTIITEKHILCK